MLIIASSLKANGDFVTETQNLASQVQEHHLLWQAGSIIKVELLGSANRTASDGNDVEIRHDLLSKCNKIYTMAARDGL